MEINNFIKTYRQGDVTIAPGITCSVREVIEENRRIHNAKFKIPNGGSKLKNLMFRMGWILVDTFFRNTDIDSKDLNMRSTNGEAIPLVDILKMAVKSHLTRTFWASFVNDLRRNGLKDGSVLVKKLSHGRRIVDLLNWIEPGHQMGTGPGVEMIPMTRDDMEKRKDDWQNWDEIEKLWNIAKEKGRNELLVYEYWHEQVIDGKNHIGFEVHIDRETLDPQTGHNKDNWKPQIEVQPFTLTPWKRRRKSAWERKQYGEYEELYGYKKLHLIPVDGRSVGFSLYELVRDPLKYFQEIWNISRKRDWLDLQGIFVFKSPEGKKLPQRFLQNLQTGDALEMKSEESLERLMMDKITGDILAKSDKLFEIMRMITGATPQSVAMDLPSTTTATAIVADQATAKSAYDVVIEQVSIFITEWMEDFEMPEIIEELNEEELTAIVGDQRELQLLDQWLIDHAVYSTADMHLQNIQDNPLLSPEEAMLQKESVAQQIDPQRQQLAEALAKGGDSRWVEIKKQLFKLVDYIMVFDPNGETLDKKTINDALQNRMADPNSTMSFQKMEEEFCDINNLPYNMLKKTPEEIQQSMMTPPGQPAQPGMPGMIPNLPPQ